jgi:carotenoid 1,2-hydratase
MTERGARHVQRSPEEFRVGPSSLSWDNGQLICNIHERCAPWPQSLRGRVTFSPTRIYNASTQLDCRGKHHWQAVAPHGRVKVVFENPGLSWSGTAYHDMNWGSEPLEQGFKRWTWLRANTDAGTQVLYQVDRRDGTALSFGRIFQHGTVRERFVPAASALPRGIWGMSRAVTSDAQPRLIATLEDSPFYTRNHVAITLDGKDCEAFHESLSLDRFVHPVMQWMLPFRMPRFR